MRGHGGLTHPWRSALSSWAPPLCRPPPGASHTVSPRRPGCWARSITESQGSLAGDCWHAHQPSECEFLPVLPWAGLAWTAWGTWGLWPGLQPPLSCSCVGPAPTPAGHRTPGSPLPPPCLGPLSLIPLELGASPTSRTPPPSSHTLGPCWGWQGPADRGLWTPPLSSTFGRGEGWRLLRCDNKLTVLEPEAQVRESGRPP